MTNLNGSISTTKYNQVAALQTSSSKLTPSMYKNFYNSLFRNRVKMVLRWRNCALTIINIWTNPISNSTRTRPQMEYLKSYLTQKILILKQQFSILGKKLLLQDKNSVLNMEYAKLFSRLKLVAPQKFS